jgi:MarR family transcriptional regulator for hemolysin
MPADEQAPIAGRETPLPGLNRFDAMAAIAATAAEWNEDNVGRQLNLTAKAARAYHSQRIAEVGATYGVWTILATLQSTGPLIQRELAERLQIEGPTLTRHLVRMESGGLIQRQQSASDRRAAMVELTEIGAQMYQRLATISSSSNEQLLHGFTTDEINVLRGMLMRIQDNLRIRPGQPGVVEHANESR